MTDTNDKKPTPPRKPLSLGGNRGGGRPNFSSGRTNTVVVQKKKRRLVGVPGATPAAPGSPAVPAAPAAPKIDKILEAAKRLGLSLEKNM